MTAIDVASLFVAETEASLTQDQLDILQAEGFSVTSWGDFDPARVLVAADARALKALADLIPLITKGGFLSESYGDWLTLLASSNYNEARQLATNTQRWLRLTDASGSPQSFVAGDIVMAMASGLIFRSVAYSTNASAIPLVSGSSGTLPALGHLDVLFAAESPGSAYNGATSGWSLVTSFPGVTAADAPAGVTSLGTDQQQDGPLRLACSSKWARQGVGANDDAYAYLCTHTPGVMAAVTRVTVHRHTPLPGQVTAYVAGPTSSGPDGASAIDAGSVTAIQSYIGPASHKGVAPNCVDFFATAATFKKIAIVGTVTAVATELAAAKAAAESALNAWASTAPIGGRVSFQKVIAKIMGGLSDDPINDSAITSPAADVALTDAQVPYFDTTGLVWVPA